MSKGESCMKKVKRAISILLVLAFLLQSIAISASAEEDPFETGAPTAEETIRPASDSESNHENLQVLYEVEEQREAAVKHFRLSDGTYVAASYPVAVHYEVTEDEWEEIDNTLTLNSTRQNDSMRAYTTSSDQIYTTVNGENQKTYAAVLHPNEELVTLKNSGCGIQMVVLSPETAEELLQSTESIPIPSPESTPIPEENESSKEEPSESSEVLDNSEEIGNEESKISEIQEEITNDADAIESDVVSQDINILSNEHEENISNFLADNDALLEATTSSESPITNAEDSTLDGGGRGKIFIVST